MNKFPAFYENRIFMTTPTKITKRHGRVIKNSSESYEEKKREPSAWGYNRATLFLGDINTRTRLPRLGGGGSILRQ
jgi:hypothetical protein